MKSAINWFELPAIDYNRAKKFYETVLGIKIEPMPNQKGNYGVFPADIGNGGVGGGLVSGDGYEPSQKGSLVYLNGGDDLSEPLGRVEKAGGKIIMPKTSIGENGFIAMFIDTEGNKVALHSMN